MLRIKTTSGVRDLLPADLQGKQAKADKDNIWLDYPVEQMDALMDALATASATHHPWPLGWDLGTTQENIGRAFRAYMKSEAKAQAKADGKLDPEIVVTLEKLIKRVDAGTSKKILAAYAAIGVSATQVDKNWDVTVPGHRTLRVWDLSTLRCPWIYGETPEHQKAREYHYIGARRTLREMMATALGVLLPEDLAAKTAWLQENGFLPPAKPKVRRHGDWTCGCCWGVHAVGQDGLLVHHGYRRPGYGYIIGDCSAVGYEPWERSTKATEMMLEYTMARAVTIAKQLADGYDRVPVRGNDGKYDWVDQTDTRYTDAEKTYRDNQTRVLEYLWQGGFLSIPWLRAAIRGWQPETTGAVGAPDVTPTEACFNRTV